MYVFFNYLDEPNTSPPLLLPFPFNVRKKSSIAKNLLETSSSKVRMFFHLFDH